ncbi:hypothetical protein CKO28_02430 [Rhodovibrio sodomensis]|uniref:Type 4 secretion system PilS N-terminal domain-containing protein n=1 Tax=Rhodovibrio sodomensis TaxID=1088 RepID=A0ABS1D905_9PROT|nr:hypothetical protein [Rhodovibrio sodomensis]
MDPLPYFHKEPNAPGPTPRGHPMERSLIKTLTLTEMQRRLRRRRGFAMTEVLMALVLILVAGLLGYNMFATGTSTNKLTRANTELQAIATKVYQGHSASASYTDLDTEGAITAGWIPPQMVISDAEAVNPWKGSVEVEEGSVATQFDITYSNIPLASCVDLVTRSAAAMSSSLVEISSGSDSISFDDAEVRRSGISPSDAIGLCDQNTSTVEVTWTVQ